MNGYQFMYLPRIAGGGPFTFGERQVVDVATNSLFELPVSSLGVTVTLPAGGHGRLAVSVVTGSTDAVPGSGQGVQVTYSGTDTVQLRVPAAAGRYAFGYQREPVVAGPWSGLMPPATVPAGAEKVAQ